MKFSTNQRAPFSIITSAILLKLHVQLPKFVRPMKVDIDHVNSREPLSESS